MKTNKKSLSQIAADRLLDGNSISVDSFAREFYGNTEWVSINRTCSLFGGIRKRIELLTTQYMIYDREKREYRLVKTGEDTTALKETESRKKSVVFQMDKFIRGVRVIMENHPELGPVVAEKASFILHEATRPELRLLKSK